VPRLPFQYARHGALGFGRPRFPVRRKLQKGARQGNDLVRELVGLKQLAGRVDDAWSAREDDLVVLRRADHFLPPLRVLVRVSQDLVDRGPKRVARHARHEGVGQVLVLAVHHGALGNQDARTHVVVQREHRFEVHHGLNVQIAPNAAVVLQEAVARHVDALDVVLERVVQGKPVGEHALHELAQRRVRPQDHVPFRVQPTPRS